MWNVLTLNALQVRQHILFTRVPRWLQCGVAVERSAQVRASAFGARVSSPNAPGASRLEHVELASPRLETPQSRMAPSAGPEVQRRDSLTAQPMGSDFQFCGSRRAGPRASRASLPTVQMLLVLAYMY